MDVKKEENIVKSYEFTVAEELLDQVDYNRALMRRRVHVPKQMMLEHMSQLPEDVLNAWLFMFVHIRAELRSAGYNLNDLKVYKSSCPIGDVQNVDRDINIHKYIYDT